MTSLAKVTPHPTPPQSACVTHIRTAFAFVDVCRGASLSRKWRICDTRDVRDVFGSPRRWQATAAPLAGRSRARGGRVGCRRTFSSRRSSPARAAATTIGTGRLRGRRRLTLRPRRQLSWAFWTAWSARAETALLPRPRRCPWASVARGRISMCWPSTRRRRRRLSTVAARSNGRRVTFM